MEPLFKIMAKYSWSDIHYSNSFLPSDNPTYDNPDSWYVGTRTGPNNTDICIIKCVTQEQVDKYKSPPGNSLKEATHKSRKLYEELILLNKFSSCRK